MATVTDRTGSSINTDDNNLEVYSSDTNVNRFCFGEMILNDVILNLLFTSNYSIDDNGSSVSINDGSGTIITISDMSGSSISMVDRSGS